MSNARNLADLLDSNGDVVSGALDNVPPADVVNDTTPQLGGDLASNGNDINFGDNDKANFGAGNDLQIYHDGSNTYLAEVGGGDFYFRGQNILVENGDGSKRMAEFIPAAQTSLAYNGSYKLATTNTGVNITGALTINGSAPSFGKVLQVVRGADKGASTNSGNWYFNYTSSPAYNAGYEVSSCTLTAQKAAGSSEILLMSQGIYSEESDNTDGFGGVGISYYNNTTSASGWISVIMRGRQVFSTYQENIGDSGVICNGKMTSGWSAGDSITFYLRIFNNHNNTKVIKTGHVPASSSFGSSTSLGSTGYKSWLVAMEVSL